MHIAVSPCTAIELKNRIEKEEERERGVFTSSQQCVRQLFRDVLLDKIDALSEEQPEVVPGSDLAEFMALQSNAVQLDSVIADRIQMLYARPLLLSSMLFNVYVSCAASRSIVRCSTVETDSEAPFW